MVSPIYDRCPERVSIRRIVVHCEAIPHRPSIHHGLIYFKQMKIIKQVIGVTPTCFRPPYGDIDDRVRAVAKALGLRVILWTTDSFDWEVGATPGVTPAMVDANYQNLINGAQNGSYNNVSFLHTRYEGEIT